MLKDALESIENTLGPFLTLLQRELESLQLAARADDKTPLQNALALAEISEDFAISEVDDKGENIIVFADIDSFKNVNSLYGQAVGDTAITAVGEQIKAEFADALGLPAFRVSGDEFVLLLRRESLGAFKERTVAFERCRVSFVEGDSAEEKIFFVKVSFGIAAGDGESDFRTLRNRAEMACKKAKTFADRRFCEWTPELERLKTKEFRETCPRCETVITCYVPETETAAGIPRCPICEYVFGEEVSGTTASEIVK